MRIIVFFDLPVQTKSQRRDAVRFRSFLLKDGYHMVQYSVYARVCPGTDAVEKHRQRIMEHLPKNGAIRMLTVTEKQFAGMTYITGQYKTDVIDSDERLVIL